MNRRITSHHGRFVDAASTAPTTSNISFKLKAVGFIVLEHDSINKLLSVFPMSLRPRDQQRNMIKK